LIFVEIINKASNAVISNSFIDINGLFIVGCHSAVGSALTMNGLTL
jgi:hypothetical protein